jgi:hypothetical protein
MRNGEGGPICEAVTLSDGSVAYVRKRRGVPLAEEDLAAIEGFNQLLKDTWRRDHASQEGVVEEGSECQYPDSHP